MSPIAASVPPLTSAWSIDIAEATKSAPNAIDFAQSMPFEIPPDAITFSDGQSLFKRQTDFSASIVGIPQSQNISAFELFTPFFLVPSRDVLFLSPFLLLKISTPAQLVPPAPATSIIFTPTSINRRATSDEIPAPISLTIKEQEATSPAFQYHRGRR